MYIAMYIITKHKIKLIVQIEIATTPCWMQDKWMSTKEPLISLDFLHYPCVYKLTNQLLLSDFLLNLCMSFSYVDSVYDTQMALKSVSICT